jgi:cellobiose phosphorylase
LIEETYYERAVYPVKYGYFNDEEKEYVITNPCTPVKWINYIGSLSFGGFVDHTGGALLCCGDPALNRITRYLALQPASDFKGTTLYLRRRARSGFDVFSPFFVPMLRKLDLFECRVGLGYTKLVSVCAGLRTTALFFVPQGDTRLLIDITVANVGSSAADVDLVPVAEYSHFDALKQLTNADWVPQTMQSRASRSQDGSVVLSQYAFMMRDTRVNFMTSNMPVSSFESDRRELLGNNEYGTWSSPLRLREEELGNSEANRGDNIGALMHHLGEIRPAEEKRLIVQIGQAASVKEATAGITRYRDPANVDAAFSALGDFWKSYLGRLQVRTPDVDADRMLNIHNPRQCYITLTWSRYLSLYQLGYGARGIGFRDSSQDAMGALASVPDQARDLILRLLSVQTREGFAMHQFNPATMEATMGDAREREDRPQYYSDDALWMVLAVCEYLKETGDFAFLSREVPFYDKARSGEPLESGPVLEHLRRALRFTRGNRGRHGLPLLGFADWNDTVNLPAGAESVFTACLYGKALLEMAGLLSRTGDAAGAAECRQWHADARAALNEHAWDGAWYVRFFDADGSPMGSRLNTQGQIYINAQTWPVIAELAAPERAKAALASLHQRLNTRHGIKKSTPGFNGFDPAKGGVTTYPPGAKENCGIFLHTNPWAMIAQAITGDGDKAWQYYQQINPALNNDQVERFECEPWVYPQNILGDEHPQFGLARNSWLSGTASWVYQAATKFILGVRPEYDGLKVDPCIPSAWESFQVTRAFRGARYVITVKNPSRVCRGVKSMKVDGRSMEGTVVPVFADGREHSVEVILGLRGKPC